MIITYQLSYSFICIFTPSLHDSFCFIQFYSFWHTLPLTVCIVVTVSVFCIPRLYPLVSVVLFRSVNTCVFCMFVLVPNPSPLSLSSPSSEWKGVFWVSQLLRTRGSPESLPAQIPLQKVLRMDNIATFTVHRFLVLVTLFTNSTVIVRVPGNCFMRPEYCFGQLHQIQTGGNSLVSSTKAS